ncbi:6-phospho-3-hexuloisomerase [Cohnella hongkongensis]|uniref:6-phospho-3-hexuloisomerase n=1 Tax=Cohnella hongkongensis TaxID=178337 RepID=A0ABV9FFJ1_9BACL
MEMDVSAGLRLRMLEELKTSLLAVDGRDVEALIGEILSAKRVFIYGLGRERLMLLAFGMRLMHLGIPVHVVGDVTTPAIGAGDLWLTSSGTGSLATVEALMDIVRSSGARSAFFTAFPEAPLPQKANRIIRIPARTMREDEEGAESVQPMGSLFEQTQLLLFDWIVLLLAERLGQTEAGMAGRHTNLE